MADEPTCECRNGMRQVTEKWARQASGIDQHADLFQIEEHARAVGRQILEAQAHLGELDMDGEPRWPLPDAAPVERWAAFCAALNTVFPCPTCRPKQFQRWRNGCFHPNHPRRRCKMCKDVDA